MATAKAAPNASEHLQFSGPVYAALLPAYYLVETIKNRNVRPDGRAPEDFRKPVLNVNSLSHSNGSAIVRLGGTTCVCGVSAEIANYDTIPNPPAVDLEGPDDPVNDTETLAALNCVVPNVDLGTGCSPSIIPGQAPTSQAQALAHRLRSLLISSRMFRASDFRILYTPPKATAVPEDEPDVPPQTRVAAYWTLYISVVFLSADGGLFDAAWLAILASLTQTRLPKAWWDSDIESVLCSDNPREATRLRLRRTPVVSTLAVFEPKREKGLGRETAVWVLADPNAFEEGLCKEMVTVVWDGKRVSKLLKSGGVAVGPEEMKSIVQFGARRWLEIQTTIQSASPTP